MRRGRMYMISCSYTALTRVLSSMSLRTASTSTDGSSKSSSQRHAANPCRADSRDDASPRTSRLSVYSVSTSSSEEPWAGRPPRSSMLRMWARMSSPASTRFAGSSDARSQKQFINLLFFSFKFAIAMLCDAAVHDRPIDQSTEQDCCCAYRQNKIIRLLIGGAELLFIVVFKRSRFGALPLDFCRRLLIQLIDRPAPQER